MSLQSKLRKLQDNLRNNGWRIEWIPWQNSGKPEYYFNTPLSHFFKLSGLILFLGGGLFLLFLTKYFESSVLSKYALYSMLVGFPLIIIGMIITKLMRYSGWKYIKAKCIDWEIQECNDYRGGEHSRIWAYRMLCTFEYNGIEYKVTPESSHAVAFGSEKSVSRYLEKRMNKNNNCELLIDPKNPLHARFGKKRIKY